jgi:hypothetical protein
MEQVQEDLEQLGAANTGGGGGGSGEVNPEPGTGESGGSGIVIVKELNKAS